MAKMGNLYGSEYHLLRFLGRHRHYLDGQVCKLVGGSEIDLLDHEFDNTSPSKDREWRSLDFIGHGSSVTREWQEWWPTGRGVHNWDAVGKVKIGGSWEWLLIEAKAHVEELRTSCKAISNISQVTIGKALEETKLALGVQTDRDWMRGYYQFCNRIAALHFLEDHGQDAQMLFIYFVGDKSGPGRSCPQTVGEWESALAQQSDHIGLPETNRLSNRVHHLFLPVCLIGTTASPPRFT